MHFNICETCKSSDCDGWCPDRVVLRSFGHEFTAKELWPTRDRDVAVAKELGNQLRAQLRDICEKEIN